MNCWQRMRTLRIVCCIFFVTYPAVRWQIFCLDTVGSKLIVIGPKEILALRKWRLPLVQGFRKWQGTTILVLKRLAAVVAAALEIDLMFKS